MTMNTVSDMTPRILCSDDGPIAIVTLFNPDKLNAINGDMWRQLKRVVDALSARTDLRCIIIRGGVDMGVGGDEIFVGVHGASSIPVGGGAED